MPFEETSRACTVLHTNQYGSFLSELLLGKGYQVHGIKRRASSFNIGLIDHPY